MSLEIEKELEILYQKFIEAGDLHEAKTTLLSVDVIRERQKHPEFYYGTAGMQ